MKLQWLDAAAPACTLDDLKEVGVLVEYLAVDPQAYQPPLDALKAERGYVEQDEVALRPEMDNLDVVCAKFADEHLHTDDEVRYVLEGEGIFDIRSADDRWMRVTVQPGDLIVVPADLHHRFFLTEEKRIRCVRLFKDASGWVPHYRDNNEEPATTAS
jgi:1,2-dihydroxy-3-keto-5-methylthiopentene dioxygenase